MTDFELPPDVNDLFATSKSFDVQQFLAAQKEILRRECEALRLYEPLPLQEAFHSANVPERVIQGANQTGKAEPADEPVLTPDGWVPIGELAVGDTVIGGDGRPCKVTGVFPQGIKPVFNLTFDDGASVRCCNEHLWKCKIGRRRFGKNRHREDKWEVLPLREIRDRCGDNPPAPKRAVIPTPKPVALNEWPVSVDPYVMGVLIGDGCLVGKGVTFTTADAEIVGEVARLIPDTCAISDHKSNKYTYGIATSGQANPVTDALREYRIHGKKSHQKFVPPAYLWNTPAVRLSVLQGLMDTDGTVGSEGHTTYTSTSKQLVDDVVFLVRSLGGKAKYRTRQTSYTHKGEKRLGRISYRVVIRLPHLPLFRLQRKLERCFNPTSTTDHRVLYSVEPAGDAECVCISVDNGDRTFVTKDFIVTHNSWSAFVELARAVTNQDPHGKYPNGGIAVILGIDESHIAKNVTPYLFKEGKFRIIRDLKTNKWRAWKPWLDEDKDRKDQTMPGPPLIPQRFIDKEKGGIAWTKKALGVFSKVELTTGWTIYAHTSKGEPAAGYQADLYLIDEDIARPDWYDEAVARLTIRKGKLIWAALPLAKNRALVNLIERADDQKDSPNPTTVAFKLSIFDNPYIPKESRDANIERWKAQGEDVYRARALGELTTDQWLMYPMFNKRVHDALGEAFELKENDPRKILSDRAGEPPDNWCRYVTIDPGYSTMAAVFWAVPPPHECNGIHYGIAYDELYLHQCDARQFAEAMKRKTRDKVFEAFILDFHGGRIRELGSGRQPLEVYKEQLAKEGVYSQTTESGFLPGCSDRKLREMLVREWLNVRGHGVPRLLVNPRMCPHVVREMERFRKLVVRTPEGEYTKDEGDRRANTHAVDCVEYAVAHGLEYVEPQTHPIRMTHMQHVIAARKARAAKRRAKYAGLSQNYVNLGPPQ